MALDSVVFLLLFSLSFVFDRLRITRFVREVQALLADNYRVFRSPGISDHWKEKFLLMNSRKSLGVSLKISLLLLAFIFSVLASLKVVDVIFPAWGVFDYLITPRGIIVSVLPFMAYYLVKRAVTKSKKKNNELL